MDYRQHRDLPAASEPAPWDAYHRVLRQAQAARAQLMRNMVFTCADRLRRRICAVAEKLHINLCPLCC